MSPHFYYNLNLTQKIEDQSLIFMDIPPNGPPTLHPLLDRVWSTVQHPYTWAEIQTKRLLGLSVLAVSSGCGFGPHFPIPRTGSSSSGSARMEDSLLRRANIHLDFFEHLCCIDCSASTCALVDRFGVENLVAG